MVRFKGVSKSFGQIEALKDITFDVDKGEFVFITGPSGAGKTTLLRLLLGEYLPDTGEIFVNDTDITKVPRKDLPFYRQKVGVVFQDYKILPERTVFENVSVPLAILNVPQNEWEARISQVLKLVGLSERATLFPSQLSGGELQRTSLARALIVNPVMILADEPTGNLDWETTESIMELFDKINKEGKTIIMATHNISILEKHKKDVDDDKIKRRIIHIDKGRIDQDSKGKKEEKEEKVKVKADKVEEQK
ncbi:ATP-binding cassette domain-containing protein [Candidatus Woesebacteria bacterium]|nr:ATP-binding cassette domain-containing protein [Candidatus Woesebacteria bacterium]